MSVGFEHARKELRAASEAVGRIASAVNIEQLDRAWREFLHSIERAWNKVQARLKHEKQFHSWIGPYNTERKKDELLSYLRNARGAAEHTLAESTAVEFRHTPMRNLAVIGADGVSRLRLFDPGPFRDQVEAAFKMLPGPEFTEDLLWNVDDAEKPKVPASVARLPEIMNQGVTFKPPTKHLGATIDPKDIVGIARLGLAWYDRAIGAAEIYFAPRPAKT